MDFKRFVILIAFVFLSIVYHAYSQSAKPVMRVSTFHGVPTTQRSKPARKTECIKHPSNFREIDLPCGGYDKPSCERVCKKLGHTSAFCKTETFCLCHSGDLYSC